MSLLAASLRTVFFASAIAALAACGKSEAPIGDDCDTPGAIDECVAGAVCSNEDDGSSCRKLCTEQEQCAATENCNGITGSSLKSCQPK